MFEGFLNSSLACVYMSCISDGFHFTLFFFLVLSFLLYFHSILLLLPLSLSLFPFIIPTAPAQTVFGSIRNVLGYICIKLNGRFKVPSTLLNDLCETYMCVCLEWAMYFIDRYSAILKQQSVNIYHDDHAPPPLPFTIRYESEGIVIVIQLCHIWIPVGVWPYIGV